MPFTPQPTNNTPSTKLTVDTFNVLAENDIYLKDTTDTNASDISSIDSRVGVNETDINNILNNDISLDGVKSFNDSINPKSAPLETVIDLSISPFSAIVDRGCYHITARGNTSPVVKVEKFISGTWRLITNVNETSCTSMIFSNGSDLRVSYVSGIDTKAALLKY